MDNLSLLAQQLLLAQNVARIQYLMGKTPLASSLALGDLASYKAPLNVTESIGVLPTALFNPLALQSGLLGGQYQSLVAKDINNGLLASSCQKECNISQTCSEKSEGSAPRRSEDEKDNKTNQMKGLATNSKKIRKVREETAKSDQGTESPEKKKKVRRSADQIQRMFKCPSEYCGKSYG